MKLFRRVWRFGIRIRGRRRKNCPKRTRAKVRRNKKEKKRKREENILSSTLWPGLLGTTVQPTFATRSSTLSTSAIISTLFLLFIITDNWLLNLSLYFAS